MAGRIPPPTHTPLITLPTLVVTCATEDAGEPEERIIRLIALAMRGSEILDTPRLDQTVAQGATVAPDAATDPGSDRPAPADPSRFAELAARLRELFAGRIVIGFGIAATLAWLRDQAGRADIEWRDPPVLDVAHLAGVLEPILPDITLESLATRLSVAIDGEDRALGECLAVARIWGKLLGLLREADIRTLGEARAFAEQRAASATGDTEADWFAGDTEHQRPPTTAPTPRIEGYAFQRRLRDLMSSPPVIVEADASLREAARMMCERRIGALLVGDTGAPPDGIITERDLLRVVSEGTRDLDATRVAEIMNTPVESMAGNEMLYRALGRMDRLGIRHLCVVDAAGAAVGMISQRNLLQHRARGVDMLGDAIARADNTTALIAAYERVPEVASHLVAEGLDGLTVARFISGELRALTARAAELALEDMKSRGLGPAPAAWCLLVLGSGGRGESLLGTDQDNALIHAGDAKDDAWFAEFGDGIAERLDRAGVPRCKGGVMAATPQWRGTHEEWSRRIENWLRRARPEDLLNIDIFFDLVPVAGETDFARHLHGEAVHGAATNLPFIGLLAESVNAVAPRLGFMGSLPSAQGRIDLKRDGLLPLVSFARTLALRTGSTARSTPERLRDAVAAGRLPDGDAAALIDLHVDLLTLVLHQQLVDLDAGSEPSSRVELKELSRAQRSDLKHRLKHLQTIVHELRATIAG